MNRTFRAGLALLLCVPGFACAQQSSNQAGAAAQAVTAPAPQQQGPVLAQRAAPAPANAGEGRIQLDVLVTDKAGSPVEGLTQQDFTLMDDGQARPILSLHAYAGAVHPSDPPVQAIVLLDTVNMNYATTLLARTGVDKFLHANGGHLAVPTSIFVFSQQGIRGTQQPSTDGNALSENLKEIDSHFRSVDLRPGGEGWGDMERLKLSLQAMMMIAQNVGKQPGRKLLFWVSPGWPMEVGVNLLSTGRQQSATFNSIVKLSSMLREGRISVYSATLGYSNFQTGLYQQFLKGVPSPKQASINDVNLKVLAIQSGGRVLGPDNDPAPQLENFMQDAGAYYTLSFDPPHAKGPDEYHDLQVQAGKPGLKVRTTTGYYDEP
jgi:VWFA-related protein